MRCGEGQGESIYEDATAHDRGVPYLVGHPAAGGTLYIGGSSGLATLTVEPGVTFRIKKGGVISVDRFTSAMPAHGALVAAGRDEHVLGHRALQPELPGGFMISCPAPEAVPCPK